jgi:UDP:flavonoid glycosyltransferase YjiC (YdhE family)
VTETRDVVLTTMFSKGDVVPFVRLGSRLVARGHRVTLVTHASYRSLAEEAGLAFATWDTPEEHAAMMNDGELFNDIVGFEAMYERHVLPKLSREADALRAHCTASTVLVTRCGPALAARAVAEQTGAALVEAFLGPGHVSPPEVLAEFARPFSAAIAALRGRDEPIDAWIRACNARFGLWPDWFAPAEPHWPPDLALVGFVAEETADARLSPELASVLDGPGPRFLLACGTGHFLTREVVEACAQVAAALGATLFVSTPFGDLVPQPLPSHVRWYTSLPYGVVIPRMDLVIHHGGIGTVHDALRAGVPQIALGTGGDRPVNASCIQRLAVGRYVRPSEWSEAAILDATRGLLADDARRACAQAAARLAAETGDAACRFVESVPRESFRDAIAREATGSPVEPTTSGSPADRARLAALTPAQRALLLKRLRKRDS